VKKFFRRLRQKKEDKSVSSNSTEISTAPLSEMPFSINDEEFPKIEPRQFMIGSGQSVGMKRDHNEDSLFTLTVTIGNSTWNQPMGIFIIADGMGGHHHGEIASDIAIRTVAGSIIKKLHPIIANTTKTLDEPLQEILQESVIEAQNAINKISPGSGTTLTALLCLDQQMTIAHIGDSRAYTLQPGGRITAITRDHSVARRLEELGQISSTDALNHPQRNVLYRSLGISESLEVDIFTETFPNPGFLLICSDGLWGVIPDKEIYTIVYSAKSLQIACQDLVKAANDAGGPDNISVILVQLTQ
jgi:PPM family protein phosphatase